MHGLVALDADVKRHPPGHAVVRPAARRLSATGSRRRPAVWPACRTMHQQPACSPATPAARFIWLQATRSRRTSRSMTLFRLPEGLHSLPPEVCGELATDVSDASGTGFFDTRRTRRWVEDADRAGGPGRRPSSPRRIESDRAWPGRDHARRRPRPRACPRACRVYFGGGDAVIQTTGAGLVQPGVLGVVIGTSGNVSMASGSLLRQSQRRSADVLQQRAGPLARLRLSADLRRQRTAGIATTLCQHLHVAASKAFGDNVYDLMGLRGRAVPFPAPTA